MRNQPVRCPKCRKPATYIRTRYFEDSKAVVWMCDNPKCEYNGLYFYDDTQRGHSLHTIQQLDSGAQGRAATSPNAWRTIVLPQAQAEDQEKNPQETTTTMNSTKEIQAPQRWPIPNFDTAEVTLYLRLPYEIKRRSIPLTISRSIAECLSPLPSTREIQWDVVAQKIAREMRENRQRLAAEIAQHVTHVLLEAFAARDTINGYSPEEWRKMNP